MVKIINISFCLIFVFLFSQCRTLNTAEKLDSVNEHYRGMSISPDNNKLLRSGDYGYVEFDVCELEKHVYWIQYFTYLGGSGCLYRVKKDSEEPSERKYLRFSWKDLDQCNYPYVVPGVGYEFYRYPHKVNKEDLLDEDIIAESGAHPQEWPDSWKKISPLFKENLYVVEEERAWYSPMLAPFEVALFFGVDLPSGLFFVLWDGIFPSSIDDPQDAEGNYNELKKHEE